MAREFLAFFNGGLNTAQDPSIMPQNQITEAVGMEFRPPRRGLFNTGGRSRVDATASAFGDGGSEINGLMYVRFDRSDGSVSSDKDHLIVTHGAAVELGEIDQSASSLDDALVYFQTQFVTFASSATGVNAAHYRNAYFMWNGNDPNWVLSAPDLASTPPTTTEFTTHGTTNVTAIGTYAATNLGAGGTIPAGDYECWYSYSDDGVTHGEKLRASYNGALTTLTLTASGSINFIANAAHSDPAGTGLQGWSLFNYWLTVGGGKYPNGFLAVDFTTAASSITVSALDTSTPYPTVGPIGGIQVSANDEPPVIYDAIIFNDSLVCIPATDRRTVKYSLSDETWYFPTLNFINLDDDLGDNLNGLIEVNNSVLAFSSRGGIRLDILPRHTDGDTLLSSRSRIKEPFSRSHGLVSTRGKAVFSIFGQGELCLFVCRDGIHITDGYNTGYASSEIDWENTVDIPTLSRSSLTNNPKRHRIEFRYASKADSAKWERLDLYYHPEFLSQDTDSPFPRMAILGPTDVPGPLAAVGVKNGDWIVYTGSDAEKTIWNEGTGIVDNLQLVDASGTINKRMTTRKFYFADVDGSFETQRMYTHQSQTTASGSATLTLIPETDDLGAYSATSTVDFSLKGAQPHETLNDRAQNIRARIVKDDGGTWQEINFLVFVIGGESVPLASAKSSS